MEESFLFIIAFWIGFFVRSAIGTACPHCGKETQDEDEGGDQRDQEEAGEAGQ
jgi:hypothetical protein